MSIQKKRTYNSGNRNAQAAQTKKRILASARELFRSEGYECVTIEKLAKNAAVSAPTIYSLYHSKRGVLFALMDEALPLDEIEAMVEEGKKEKSPKKRIMVAAKIARRVYDNEKAEMDIFRSASVLAPEFKDIEKEREERRYFRQEETVNTLMKEKSLIKGLSLSQARDILWSLTGRDLYRMLVIERGWTSDAYEIWLGNHLANSLIVDSSE